MPTYEYKCIECKHTMQLIHKMSEQPTTICPSCMKSSMVRVPGGGLALHFKGSGFYETDYKNK